jgi:hypothetical protein
VFGDEIASRRCRGRTLCTLTRTTVQSRTTQTDVTVRCHEGDGIAALAHVVDVAEDVLQRLQLLHKAARVTALEQWRKEVCLVPQFFQCLAHLVALPGIKPLQVFPSSAGRFQALRSTLRACLVMGPSAPTSSVGGQSVK